MTVKGKKEFNEEEMAFAKPPEAKQVLTDIEGDDIVMVEAKSMGVDSLEMGKQEFAEENGVMKGEVQPIAYQDAWAAVLFIIQFISVVGVAISYSSYIFSAIEVAEEDLTDDDGLTYTAEERTTITYDASSIFVLLIISYVVAGSTTMVALALMMRYSEALVKVSFFVAPLSFLAVATIFFIADDGLSTFFAFVAIFISLLMICMWFFYKKHIPFAAANLRTALSALRVNTGTYIFAFLFSIVSFLTMVLSLTAITGVQAKAESEGTEPCEDPDLQGEMCYKNPPNTFLILFLLLGLYWTQQVITNIVHVTTAGVVGTWWFTPIAEPSSRNITSSLGRALTYSFGSICFGSLLIAIMQVLEQMARSQNRNGRGNILTCLIQCIIQCLRGWLEYFNSWAFVYVALYGYPYIEAGKNVIQLFRHRGWTTIIADRLVFRVLFFCNLAVAAVSGSLAILCDFAAGPFFPGDNEASHVLSFFVAFFVGLFISNVVLFVIESAVRTAIVCFAESPAEFDEHHPDLSENMKAGWAEAYPTVMGGVLT
mmetsp:Transcript_11583/g.17007  ORF Transcript_11583/g.17007 Transcript_11583/m.17007 type:complete len:540 (+) Transcript_11583:101-1720(+)